MANFVLQAAATSTQQRPVSGARRPAAGEFLRAPLALLAAALLLTAGAAQAQQGQAQEDDQNLVQAPEGQPGADEPPPPPLPSGEAQWAGDDTSAYGQEQAPEGEGDDYTQGYQDGKEDALADQKSGPTMDDFHASLDQSGQWEQTAEYGPVWRPRVYEGWRPYTQGSWVYTSYGWTWASSESWGWAAYHYGRWMLLPDGAWAWLPGRVWAPAWVAWRWGGGYAGWAPLGPRGAIYWHSNGWWTVVEQRHFLHSVRSVMIPQERHAGIFAQAHPVRPVYGRVGGPTRNWVGGAVGHTISPVRVETTNHPGQAHSQEGGVLRIYAPQTRPIARPIVQPSAGVGRAAGQSNTPRWMPRPGWGGKPGNATPPIRGNGGQQGNTNHGTWPSGPGSGHGQPHTQPGNGSGQQRPQSGGQQIYTPPQPHAQPQGNPPPHENRGVPVQAHPITPGGAPVHFGGVAVHPGGSSGGGQPPPHAQPAPQQHPAPTPPVVHPPKAEHQEKKDK